MFKEKLQYQALILLLVLGFAWGSAFALARYVMSHGVSPVAYSFLSVAVPALILLCYCYWQGLKVHRVKISYCLLAAIFGIVVPNVNKYWLATRVPSGVLALIVSVTPFFIYPLALLCKEEQFRFSRVLAVLIGGAGMIIMAASHGLPGLNFNYWLIMGLLTPFSYAICAVYVAKFTLKESNIVVLTTGMLICATFILLPFTPTSTFVLPHFGLNGVWAAIVAEIILVIIGYIALFKVLQLSGAVNYSMVNGIAAIVGLYWGYCFFHEHLSARIATAIICIVTGVVLLHWSRLRATS